MLKNGIVAVAHDAAAQYPVQPPFHPSEHYPEAVSTDVGSETNRVYALIRKLFVTLGLDRERFGTPAWNPLGDLISPGDRVVVKPNMVCHVSGNLEQLEPLVTHAAVVRAILDYVVRALAGSGAVIVGDAPLQGANFEKIAADAALDKVVHYVGHHASLPVSLVDFRQERSLNVGPGGLITRRISRNGDAPPCQVVDLGSSSALSEIEADYKRFGVMNYSRSLMRTHQTPGVHQYVITRAVLEADVVINVPKMKTHKRAAMTCALKNFVGINGRKDCLPHHRRGSRQAGGGDEFLHNCLFKSVDAHCDELAQRIGVAPAQLALNFTARVSRFLAKRFAKDRFLEGAWYGNDTVWRMVHDLNRILQYANAQGELGKKPARRLLHIVDAIVAGEGEGPLQPSPIHCGMLIAGASALSVDAVAATLMGFDLRRIPLLAKGFATNGLQLGVATPEEIGVFLEGRTLRLDQLRSRLGFRFKPPAGWRGHVELEDPQQAAAGALRATGSSPA